LDCSALLANDLSDMDLQNEKGWLRKAPPFGAISDQIYQLSFHSTEEGILIDKLQMSTLLTRLKISRKKPFGNAPQTSSFTITEDFVLEDDSECGPYEAVGLEWFFGG
jgi:hypothetical protein